MNKFEFKNNNIVFNIAGEVYEIEPTLELKNTTINYQQIWEKALKKAKSNVISEADVIDMCKGFINVVLGEDTFDKIFENRKPNLHDCQNLVVFIINEMTEYYAGTNKTPSE